MTSNLPATSRRNRLQSASMIVALGCALLLTACGGGGGGGGTAAPGPDPPARRSGSARSAIPGVLPLAVHARLRGHAGDGHALHQRRGGAVARDQSPRREQSGRRLAAGSLVEWRRQGPGDGSVVRRRPHLDAADARIHALRGRKRGQRRRLRARFRSVGVHFTRRHRLPERAFLQRAGIGAGLVQRGPRQPLDRRRQDVECAGNARPRRPRFLQRQGFDHRRSDRRALRLRGVGPALRVGQRAGLPRAHDRRRRDLGSRRDRSTIRDPPARRSTTRSSCFPMARSSCSSRASIPVPATRSMRRWSWSDRATRGPPGRRPSRCPPSRRWARTTPTPARRSATARTSAAIAVGPGGDARRRVAGRALLRRTARRRRLRALERRRPDLVHRGPVNRDPSVQAFEPAVAIRADGTFGVTYFDTAQQHARSCGPADRLLARALDGRHHLAREPRRRSVQPGHRPRFRRTVPRRLPGPDQHRERCSCRSTRR